MTVFCTLCSAEKDRSGGELPAIQRYHSHRINSVYIAALSLGIKFLILSRKYDILEPSDPIPYYAHLLQSSEVPEHSKMVAEQLEAHGVKDLVVFARPVSDDENAKPYFDCIRIASQKAGIELKFVDLLTNSA
ncbi:MAG: hypothetical protein MUO76_20320 [Anaerolineaceae bacterium]|nr:hypothetical protein [Anaerolineaceae bacterium]